MKPSQTRTLTLTPVGSCRIVNPIKRAQPYFHFQANFKRVYGFTHTSSEALQQIRFMLGMTDIPERVRPFIFRPAIRDTLSEQHTPSDVYIVEISSQKKIMAYGCCLQINYLTRYFSDFFSQPERARIYWSLATPEQAQKRDAYLNEDPCFAGLSADDKALLKSLHVEQMDEHAIGADMQEIVRILGRDNVIFMTHIDALTQAGNVIPSRSRLIHHVENIASRMGIPCINPTHLMATSTMGQKRALEKNGDDLTHYTDFFGDTIVAALFKTVIHGRINPVDDTLQAKQDQMSLLVSDIHQWLANDDIVAASQAVFCALREQPHDPTWVQLRAVIFNRLGHYEQAYQDIVDVETHIGMTDSTLRCRLKALSGLKHWQDALSTAEIMLSNEIDDEEVLTIAAQASDALGRFDVSWQYWKRVLQFNPSVHEGWVNCLRSTGYFADDRAFVDTFYAGMASRCVSVAFIETGLSLAIAFHHEPIFTQALAWLLQHQSDVALTTLSDMTDTGLIISAASCIKNGSHHGAFSTAFKSQLHDLFVRWHAKAREHHCVDDFVSLSTALVYTYSALTVYPHAGISHVHHEVKSAWRQKLKATCEDNDVDTMMAGANIVWPLLEFDPVSTITIARVFVSRDAWKEACRLSHMTLMRHPNITSLQAIALRSLRYIDDIHVQVDLIADLMRIAHAFDTPSMNLLFEKECKNVATRALKQVRQKRSEGRQDEALSLLIKMKGIDPNIQRLVREFKQIIKMCDDAMKDAGHVIASYENLAYAKKLLVFDNENAYALKYAALNSMHLREYEHALDYWQRLESVSGSTDAVNRQIHHCQSMLQKQGTGDHST